MVPRGRPVGRRTRGGGGGAVGGGSQRGDGVVDVVVNLQGRRHEEIDLGHDLRADAGRGVRGVGVDHAVRSVADRVPLVVDEKWLPDTWK